MSQSKSKMRHSDQKSLIPETENSGSQVMRLGDLEPGQQGDCFVLLVSKDRAKTRDGKPYYRVNFRDQLRTATSMIWSDTAWFAPCELEWQVGCFYKIRGCYNENQYGPQIELDRIRDVEEADKAEGFDPAEFFESTRFDAAEMFDKLVGLANEQISDVALRQLVVAILEENADQVKTIAAASRNHHAYSGGFVEHVLSVTRTAVYLADKYSDYYSGMKPPLSKSLVVAGAILHDIGKLIELDCQPQGSTYTAEGRLVGHILLGRDIVREKAVTIPEIDREILLRLEHIIISHQNLPEWGSPIAPHTPEALLVHYADDIDAKFQMMATALEVEPTDDEEFTSRDNVLRRPIFRGLVEDH